MEQRKFTKKEITWCIIVIIAVIVFYIGFNIWQKYNREKEAKILQQYNTWYDTEVSDDEDVYGYDLEHQPEETFVSIENVDIIYGNLTLKALQDLRGTCENYLFEHGYDKARKLTILEDTIGGDRSYFYFVCAIEEYPNTKLNVTYDMELKDYVLTLN